MFFSGEPGIPERRFFRRGSLFRYLPRPAAMAQRGTPVLGERNGKSGGAGERRKSLKYRRLGTPGPAAFHLYQHTTPRFDTPGVPKGQMTK